MRIPILVKPLLCFACCSQPYLFDEYSSNAMG
jgi:hypothetical protein